MAVLKIKVGKAGRNTAQYYSYLTKKSKTRTGLVSSLNCSLHSVASEMERTKQFYNKADGRQFYDFIQTFDQEENITPEKAHSLGVELAQKTFGKNYEVAIVTHIDKGYLHNHIMLNSVSFTTGKKFANKRSDLYYARKVNEEILKRENLLTLKKLKKQNRTGRKVTQAEIHMAKTGILTDKAYILDCSNKTLKVSKNMSEYINRMSSQNIKVVFTDHNTYFKYNDLTYGQNSLGKEVSLDFLAKSFNKKTSHITLLKNALISAKDAAKSYNEFIEILSNTKSISLNQRGEKTLSFTYGKRKPVRSDYLGYSVYNLKAYFEFKEEYDIFNNSFKEELNKNKLISYNEILLNLKNGGIINFKNITDKYYSINDKKINANNILKQIQTHIKEQEELNQDLINNIFKYLNNSLSLENLFDKYNINSIIIGEEIIFTNNNSYYILQKNKVDTIFIKNTVRKNIWDSLKTATSLPMFYTLTGSVLKVIEGQEKLFIGDHCMEEFGIVNSYGKNTLCYENVINKINDNKYFKLKDTTTFRGQLRKDIFNLLNTSSNMKEFYICLNKLYKSKLEGDEIYIYNSDTKSYFNIKELSGKNDDKNSFNNKNLNEFFSGKKTNSSGNFNLKEMELLRGLFAAASYKNNYQYNEFSEQYFKSRRIKDENKAKNKK